MIKVKKIGQPITWLMQREKHLEGGASQEWERTTTTRKKSEDGEVVEDVLVEKFFNPEIPEGAEIYTDFTKTQNFKDMTTPADPAQAR